MTNKPDEYVSVEDMLDSANVMGRSLIDLLARPLSAASTDGESYAF
ncbi:MAG: hypothetical protein RDA78_10115 [Roseibium sp.]